MSTMDSDDESSSSSSSASPRADPTPPVEGDEYHDLPLDFGGGEAESETDDSDDDAFESLDPSTGERERPSGMADAPAGGTSSDASVCSEALAQEVPPTPASSNNVPHRGSLRRMLNPSSFHCSQNATSMSPRSSQSKSSHASSSWPLYAINVAVDGPVSEYPPHLESDFDRHTTQGCYQILFDRQQYEFCTRLFAVLDTESQSVIGPECVREFVCLRCPVVRRRDEAIFALNNSEGGGPASPTFDEIWDVATLRSDPRRTPADASVGTAHRIGIEGWMVFCRLLALAHHQESQRRFASRHLQQMMRHKHGTGATRMSPNEVVVVVDNPPPGPPSAISVQSLMEVERERQANQGDACIQGWPFCPLPSPELDLDHSVVPLPNNTWIASGIRQGIVSVEPFSCSSEGGFDFILRFQINDSKMVVRRSYADFLWLNTILKLNKRPGMGHLCGRILPPFPSKQGALHQRKSMLSRDMLQSSEAGHHHPHDISERAIAAAKSGMGMISSMAKSMWSGYVTGTASPAPTPSSSLSNSKPLPSPKSSGSAQEVDVGMVLAHRIQRYLSYLLENDAFSSSFSLNAILQASQSGLESAKQTLHDHAKLKKRQGSTLAPTALKGGSHTAASIFSALVSKSTSTSSVRLEDDDDTPWVRAAAQVALALQFHGILETTGHETTSAKIQHASLPKFRNQPSGSWDDEVDNGQRSGKRKFSQNVGRESPGSDANFECGVINVESELADEQDLGGFDMLPSPGPSEEIRVLNAGRATGGEVQSSSGRSGFAYETASKQLDENYGKKGAVLGSIRVESDIDKLRDIIRSINRTLQQLHKSSASVQLAQGARNLFGLSLLRGVDSWVDSGAEIISQRALVNGVAALELLNSSVEESNRMMTDDLLWQSSLSTSAVAAVSEVRDAVRASHTASRAKSAAFIAAEKAKKAYESCDHSSSKEKIQHTQSEASNAQSHAIHATVVEYEANIAKKRSAISLAQDVKSWNIHRKRELLRTCVEVAKSQQEACRKAADAWESLRDGLIASTGSTFAIDDVNDVWSDMANMPRVDASPLGATTTYANSQEILASESSSTDEEIPHNDARSDETGNSSRLHDWDNRQQEFPERVTDVLKSVSTVAENSDAHSMKQSLASNSGIGDSSEAVYCIAPPKESHLNEDYFSFHQALSAEAASNDVEHEGFDTYTSEDLPDGDVMSTSMQSLIDGLMAWGADDEQKRYTDSQTEAFGVGTSNDSLLG